MQKQSNAIQRNSAINTIHENNYGKTKFRRGIWYELYGQRSDEFIDGIIAGVRMYAVWNDGVQYVGVSQTPLKKVIEAIREQLS